MVYFPRQNELKHGKNEEKVFTYNTMFSVNCVQNPQDEVGIAIAIGNYTTIFTSKSCRLITEVIPRFKLIIYYC